MFTIQLLLYDTIDLFPAKAGVTQCFLNGLLSFYSRKRGAWEVKVHRLPLFFVIIVLKVAAKGDVMDLVLADRSFSFA